MMIKEMSIISNLENGGESKSNDKPLSGDAAIMAARMILPHRSENG